jgi:hypothetical protein
MRPGTAKNKTCKNETGTATIGIQNNIAELFGSGDAKMIAEK